MLFRLIGKNLLQRPLRYVLTAFAITFSVAAVTAVFIFTDGLRITFDEIASNAERGYQVKIRSDLAFGDDFEAPPVPAEVIEEAAALDGVTAVQPVSVQVGVVAIDDEGTAVVAQGGPNFGISWETELAEPRLFINEGVEPASGGEFVVDTGTFDAGSFTIGNEYRVLTSSGSDTFTLVGTFFYASADRNEAAAAQYIALSQDEAIELFNGGVGYDELLLVSDSDDQEALAAKVQQYLDGRDDNLVAQTQIEAEEELQGQFAQIAGIFRTVLLVFAIIILVVSAFLIFNVFNITLGQRIKELGSLRALGAQGAQVTNMMMGEALLLGIISTLIGLPAGWALARLLRFGLGALGFPDDISLPINTLTILLAVVVGVVVTMAVALIPALLAQRVTPMAALTDNAMSQLDPPIRPILGVALLVPAALLFWFSIVGGGWLPKMLPTILATMCIFFAFRFFAKRTRNVASFVMLGIGLVLLTIVRFGEFELGETFGLLGAAAFVTVVGAALVSAVVAAPASRILGHTPSAVIVGFLGVFFALAAVGALIGGVYLAIDGTPAGLGLIVPAVIIAIGAYALLRTARGGFGLTGRLGRSNAARNPYRTASTASALMIGLALVTAVTVIGDSVKSSIGDALESSIKSDFLLRTTDGAGPPIPISAEAGQRIEALPEVESVLPFRFSFSAFAAISQDADIDQVQSKLQEVFLALANTEDPNALESVVSGLQADDISVGIVNATEIEKLTDHIDPDFIDRDLSVPSDKAIYLEDTLALERGVEVGDPYRVIFLDNQVEELTVAGIYQDGFVLPNQVVDLSLWEKHFRVTEDAFLTANIADGFESEEVRAAIEQEVEVDYPIVIIQDRDEFASAQRAQIDQVLAIVNMLLILSAIIAVLGIAIALSLAVFERVREIGLLRAVGTTQPQVRWVIRWEGVIVAAFGGIVGVLVGVGLGILATQKMPEFIVSQVSVPPVQLILYILVAAMTGMVAGAFPAWYAGRLNVLDAIATE